MAFRLLPSSATCSYAVLIAVLCAGSSAFSLRGREAQDPSRRATPATGPLSPDQALASFELEEGYRIELAAAEPLIQDPVAIAFDDRGRMYVVESRGYPGPLEGSRQPPPEQGVIALLEDTNADGRFDKRTEFARNLTYPNGIMPWDGGVFVSCAPDLLYLKDTTGDGVADERRVMLTGFDATRTPQIRFSHPTLGLDNWVYLTSGLTGGRVSVPDHPDRAPVVFNTSDSRFNPITHDFELTGGQGQFGLTFDDYGHRFVCSNRRPVMHVVLEPWYLRRNPHLAFSETAADVSAMGAQASVWPTSGDTTTASFIPSLMSAPHAGTFTAASGVHIHRGNALPAASRDSIFICESAQNLVQRQILSPDGVTFTSRPARTGRDFLTSRDTWFRPVFATNGPDGALYIVDMYRKIIDHPQYVPEQSRAQLDFEAGKDRGRIYRIVAQNWKADRKPIDLGRMSVAQLSQLLEHPNAWWRETAQRLLVERRDRSAIPILRTLAQEGRSAVARIHALWTLDALGGLDSGVLVNALRAEHAAVRENAVRLAESRVRSSPDVLPVLLRLTDERDQRVRLRVALALGETADPRAIAALADIARGDGDVSWMRAAILSSIGERSNEFLRAFASAAASSVRVKAAIMQDLGQLFGASQTPERCLDLIYEIADPNAEFGWQPAALSGMAEGLKRRGPGQESRSALMTLLSSDSAQARSAMERVKMAVARSATMAMDESAASDQRLAAIRILGHTDYSLAGKTLVDLLATQYSSEIQVAAVRALAPLPDRAAVTTLVDARRWQGFTPQVREVVLSLLMTSDSQTLVLLDALEKNSISGTDLGASRRSRLMNHRNPEIQSRARGLLAAAESGDRMQVYERLRGDVLNKPTNPARGRQVFASQCAACHASDGTGGQVGPDLSGIRNQPAEAILLHVLVPDYEIAAGYQAYVVQTKDGRTLTGRLESEAPNSVTLRDGSSQQHAILRRDIVAMSASTHSLMPNELERAMSEQDLADLIAYLKANPRPR